MKKMSYLSAFSGWPIEHFVDIDLDAAALKAALHGDDVAAVTVQIKDVRVQMADIEFHFSVPPYS